MSVPAWRSRELRFAPYIESAHANFLEIVASKSTIAISDNPYDGFTDVDIESGFFSLGRTISDFSSLYSVFGSYLSGFDVEVIWTDTFRKLLSDLAAYNLTAAEMSLRDDLDVTANLVALQLAARDLNWVGSSSFVVSKAKIDVERLKLFETIHSEAMFPLIYSAATEYNNYLNFTKTFVTEYALMMKAYYLCAVGSIGEQNIFYATRDALWPFEVLKFYTVALTIFRNGSKFERAVDKRERSNLSKTLALMSDTASGAMFGGQVGGGVGAIVGAVVGWQVGIAKLMVEKGDGMRDMWHLFEPISATLDVYGLI